MILTERVKSTIILHTERENVEHDGDLEILYKGRRPRELSNLGAVYAFSVSKVVTEWLDQDPPKNQIWPPLNAQLCNKQSAVRMHA